MSGKLRMRFDGAKVEPLLRGLAACVSDPEIEQTLSAGLESWPGVARVRIWAPGSLHRPFGSERLAAVSRSGTAIHVEDRLPASALTRDLDTPADWIRAEGLRGLGAHPWGDRAPHGVLLVLTRVPLSTDAFAWLGRVAAHAGVAHERGKRGPEGILTAEELKTLERNNLIRALEATGGKIFGDDGAAALLGLKPTTLASRVKALEIPKPDSPQGRRKAKPLPRNRYPESR